MFGGKKNQGDFASGGHTLLDRAVEITGDVKFGGTLDVDGTVVGNIIAESGSDALVRVRDNGRVQGEIRAPRVVINGAVSGDVFADVHLELASKAEVNGDVHYSVIEMVKGAAVNGSLVHIQDKTRAAAVKDSKPKRNTSSASVNRQVEISATDA